MKSFSAGSYQTQFRGQESEYRSFLPAPINHGFEVSDQNTILLLEEATRLIGELNAYSRLIPDVDYFIQMHVKSEAVSSSRIEGTKTELDEALLPEEEIDPERRDDWQEVQKYIDAMHFAIGKLESVPVSIRLIKEVHGKLLDSVRGERKLPGEIRQSQNWIGGSSIRTAHYVPPHQDAVPELLSDWEKFWHNHSLDVPLLIKIAILHYQFETIHPFLDGNGRMGRLLITLQLMEQEYLGKPVLYLSGYLEKYRQEYYDAFDRVRRENDLEFWVRFFLEGMIKTSREGKEKFENIVDLKERYEQHITKLGRKMTSAKNLLLYLFSKPLVNINEVASELGVTYKTASDLVDDFVGLNILEEKTGYLRNRLFEMTEYVDLFRIKK